MQKTVTENLGKVTAYRYAKSASPPYTGTEEEFASALASVGEVEEWKNQAMEAAALAEQYASEAFSGTPEGYQELVGNVADNIEQIAELSSSVEQLGESISDAVEDLEGVAEELEDIRTGADGQEYNSAGAAVRAQIDNLDESKVGGAYVTNGYLYLTDGGSGIVAGPLGPFSGGGGGVVRGDYEIVENQAGLSTSVANNVLVLHNDSLYGDNGVCLFHAETGVDRYGYLRASDGKYMVPASDQTEIATANPPVEAIMSVIKTWVGNTNVKHLAAGSIDNNSLFGTTCSQTDGYWSMDCSAFTSAVLMGITYDNSRCVLGTAKDNIQGDYFVGNAFPPSQYLPARAKGGLSAAETAMWLGEHKRLYSFPEDPAEALAQLQFGDIIFGSNDIYPRYFHAIEHIMIVLGTVPSQGAVIIAESIDLDYAPTYYEQIGAHIAPVLLRDSTTGKTSSYYRVWGRPDYSHIGQKRDLLIPKGAGTFTYNPFFLDAALVCRGTSDSSTVPGGKLMLDRFSAATPDFYPAIPGSVVSYTGASSCSRGVYLCRVHEFDSNYKIIKSTTIAYATNGSPATNPVTIGTTTRYLKFTFGIQSNTMSDTSVGIWLSNIADCEITMTLPS